MQSVAAHGQDSGADALGVLSVQPFFGARAVRFREAARGRSELPEAEVVDVPGREAEGASGGVEAVLSEPELSSGERCWSVSPYDSPDASSSSVPVREASTTW